MTSRSSNFAAIDLDDRRLVIDCPKCKRTIWAGSTCLHGRIPSLDDLTPPSVLPPGESAGNGKKGLNGGLGRSPRLRGK